MTPRLILIGGYEFVKNDGIDREIARISDGNIILITAASDTPARSLSLAVKKYKKYHTNILLLNTATESLQNTKIVYISGGHPDKLMDYFKTHSKLLRNIKNKLRRKEIVLCGSSAGAMVMFKQMFAHGSRGKGGTKLVRGLGLIKNNAIPLVHWDTSNADWKKRVVKKYKRKTLIAIDEHTALFCGDAGARVLGLRAVNIIKNQNVKKFANRDLISNLRLEI